MPGASSWVSEHWRTAWPFSWSSSTRLLSCRLARSCWSLSSDNWRAGNLNIRNKHSPSFQLITKVSEVIRICNLNLFDEIQISQKYTRFGSMPEDTKSEWNRIIFTYFLLILTGVPPRRCSVREKYPWRFYWKLVCCPRTSEAWHWVIDSIF